MQMPLRMLQYAGNLYEKYLERERRSKYADLLIPLPVPRLLVFYNGRKEEPDEMVLRLSDAFDEKKKSLSDIEVRVRMVNINSGHNPAVLDACRPLNEYAWTVARIRENEQALGLEAAIDEAINTMPEDFEIKNLLEQNRAEVKGMLLMEYDEAKEMDRLKEEYLRVGKQEGKIEGTYTTLADLVKDKVITLSEAAKRAGVSEKEFIKNTGLSTI